MLAPRILVVDDHPMITQSVCEALELAGYRPCALFNGQQAMDEVAREAPDLIVLDGVMPLMDGFEVLKQLRAREVTRQTPVIMLTALQSEEDMVRGVSSGATMYLAKPVEVPKLLSLIAAILGSRAPVGARKG